MLYFSQHHHSRPPSAPRLQLDDRQKRRAPPLSNGFSSRPEAIVYILLIPNRSVYELRRMTALGVTSDTFLISDAFNL